MVVAFFGHDFRRRVDVEQLHFPRKSAEEKPLLTLREGRRGECSVRFRVSIRPHGPEFRVDEFPVEAAAVEAAELRKSGAVQDARSDGRGRRTFVTWFRTSMWIKKRKGWADDDWVRADGVLLPQIVRHDRV